VSEGSLGSLIPAGFLNDVLPVEFEAELRHAQQTLKAAALARWWQRTSRNLGPASSARSVLDIAVLPLATLLGYNVLHLEPYKEGFVGVLGLGQRAIALLLALPWTASAEECWRDLRRAGRTSDVRWAIVCTGRLLQIVDTARPWSRRTLDFDLEHVMCDEQAVLTLWTLATATAVESVLDRVVNSAEAHTIRVCGSLGEGVLSALGGLVAALGARASKRSPSAQSAFEQGLTLVYRILFLLFAEARSVVPTWHTVYRNAYTIEALYRRSTRQQIPRGLWHTLQAISRLSHSGCRAGDLRVTPFNGRLFSPKHTPLGEGATLPDSVVREAVLALATGTGDGGRRRIAYGDLGVEQLGAVYERVLEYEPVSRQGPIVLTRTSTERKSTGSFYTPRSITEFLVRRTLHPLVQGRSADEILALRVLDPAMGSGAFLVAACRFIAHAAARARIDSGEWQPGDDTPAREVEVRRMVAQRCLFGVDRNPMAVQLARLSLWLTTLAVDRPLTFLDHHLASGDSLIGATLDDIARQPSASRRVPQTRDTLPLFDREAAIAMATEVLPDRFRIADEPGDTPAAVRDKERALDGLTARGAPLYKWKAAADLWCAGWFWPDRALNAATYGDLLAAVLDRGPVLSSTQTRLLLERAASKAAELQTFHWHLEFPEVFFGLDGRRRPDGGFDAVLGNPPWDMVRSDNGPRSKRVGVRGEQHDRLRFFRASGVYPLQRSGHPNTYQLFLERALQLVRSGGRLGLILPSGIATDHGSGTLRRALLGSVQIDRLLTFSNREGIFPIHRDMRFAMLTGTAGTRTDRLHCRFGIRQAAWLDALPDDTRDDPPDARPITLTRSVLEQWDREHLSIPELGSSRDLEILSLVAATIPRLDDQHEGWGARFGRELNATDDRGHFVSPGTLPSAAYLPIVEGKHLEPFRALVERSIKAIPRDAAAQLLDGASTFDLARIAYRDVASATNRLTLIAAILPRRTVSTHTVFCLKKPPLTNTSQYVLLALLNSLVANYLVRLQVTTHVTASVMARLRVPRPHAQEPLFRALASRARELEQSGIEANPHAYAELNSITARLYGLTRDQYAHIVSTFPLLSSELRDLVISEYGLASETRRHRGN